MVWMGEVGAGLNGQADIGHLQDAIHGRSVRGDFGAGNVFANMQDSLHAPSVDGDCPSRAQVG